MKRLALFASVLITLGLPALAEGDIARPELLAGWRGANGTHIAALRIDLAPEWKTYWRAPGEAGVPPHFDWSGSENIASITPVWPTPEVFELNGMQTIGYKDGLVLPLMVTLNDPSKEARIAGNIELGVCKDICMPISFGVDTLLPSKGERVPAIVSAMVDRPLSAEEANVGRVVCRVRPTEDGLAVETIIEMKALGPDETVVIETHAPDDWVTEAVTTRSGNTLVSLAEILPMGQSPLSFDRSGATITVLASGHAVEIKGCQAD
ncbi:protein-disulfide reductase DsbD family protein [Marivivens sp. LCG002]|uniref:protein-disulfide reductase DsbD domain-containing protein n=1 Tax=Marivivens sp. LCG002 TaxID=3051171 RepID=UPI00255391E2|nr:protein-disulfide reductase DsbD domain-containing protein [Marivivens sp. LCG002]WIV50544.1 protein-disulfide reductase DsbD family protein [Marivivens sp. LCG002]